MDKLNNSGNNLTSPSIDIDTPDSLNVLKAISLVLLSMGTIILALLLIIGIAFFIGTRALADSVSSLTDLLVLLPFIMFLLGANAILNMIAIISLYLVLSIVLLIAISTGESITFKIIALILSCLAIIYDIIFLSSMYQISAILLCMFVFILFHIIPTIYLFLFLKHHFKKKSKEDTESIKKF